MVAVAVPRGSNRNIAAAAAAAAEVVVKVMVVAVVGAAATAATRAAVEGDRRAGWWPVGLGKRVTARPNGKPSGGSSDSETEPF